MTHNRVAFLRAVNVGSRQVSMASLKAMFEAIGLENVKTVLQSGNVLFKARHGPASLERTLEAETEKRFKMPTPYCVRTTAEMIGVLADNPFPKQAAEDPGRLVVIFLKEAPSRPQVAQATADYRGPETTIVLGRHAYVYYPLGQGQSKLRLPWLGTARNWNTVSRIAAALS